MDPAGKIQRGGLLFGESFKLMPPRSTLLAVGLFERELARERDVWELVVEKARGWIIKLVGNEEAKLLEMKVGKFWVN